MFIKCLLSEEVNVKELFNFVDVISEESVKFLFAFYNLFKKNDVKCVLKVCNEVIMDGLMIIWLLKGGDVVGVQYVCNVVEFTRCTDIIRIFNELKSKVIWIINYVSMIKFDEMVLGNMMYLFVILSVWNEFDDVFDIVFVVDATLSAFVNVESGGWFLEIDKNVW